MNLKVIIYITEDGEIFFYTPDESENAEAVFIKPRIKKKERKPEEDDKSTH